MKRIIIFVFLLFISNSVSSQEKETNNYFPREIIVPDHCVNSDDTNRCTYNQIQQKTSVLVKKYFEFDDFKQDTLRVQIGFEVDKKGRVDDYKMVSFRSLKTNKPINIKLKALHKDLLEMMGDLPKYNTTNTKSSKYSSIHYFLFFYITEKIEGEFSVRFVKPKQNYKGGAIVEKAKAVGCVKKRTISDIRKCNSKYVRKQIQENFAYRNFLKKLDIDGSLSVRFRVSKKGKIYKIQTKGTQEAYVKSEVKRILKKMPDFTPFKINGKVKTDKYQFKIRFADKKRT